MYNVTQPNRCLAETVAHVFSVEGRNTNVCDQWPQTWQRACRCLLDQVTLALLTLWVTVLYSFRVYICTEHSIATVLLNYSILYNNGMNIVIILFLMLLFLRFYIIRYYISCINCVLKWCTLSIIVIYINRGQLTQRGVTVNRERVETFARKMILKMINFNWLQSRELGTV